MNITLFAKSWVIFCWTTTRLGLLYLSDALAVLLGDLLQLGVLQEVLRLLACPRPRWGAQRAEGRHRDVPLLAELEQLALVEEWVALHLNDGKFSP